MAEKAWNSVHQFFPKALQRVLVTKRLPCSHFSTYGENLHSSYITAPTPYQDHSTYNTARCAPLANAELIASGIIGGLVLEDLFRTACSSVAGMLGPGTFRERPPAADCILLLFLLVRVTLLTVAACKRQHVAEN